MKLHFAIVGCGHIASRHAENILRHGKLEAVCDIVPEKAGKMAEAWHCRAYTSYDEMLEREPLINIVAVCSPNGLHAEHSIKALQSGRHVLCEKPMCISLPAAWSMRDTAHFFRKKLFVVKQNRFNPPVQAVKKLIDEGKLGRILSVQVNGFWNRDARYFENSWKGSRDMDGGMLYTQFSHFIDLLIWMVGDLQDIRSIRANQLLKGVIETEDNLVCIGKLTNGALCSLNFSTSCFGRNMEGSVTILGEKGTVKIGGQYLNTLEYQQIEGEPKIQLEYEGSPNQYGFYQGSMSNHHEVYRNIESVLNGDHTSYTNAEDGLKTVALIEKIYASCS